MNFRSIADLNRDVVANLHRIPRSVDVVVGIPRSGLLPASIIALARNLPIADIDGFAAGRVLSAGSTRCHHALEAAAGTYRHALVVDDSINVGEAMGAARAKLAHLEGKLKLTCCAVYGVGRGNPDANLVFEVVPGPRMFEWNMMHRKDLANVCLDIDGVLCLDPTHWENDDGRRYLSFLESATPYYLPSHKVGTLVTNRLEKYRPQTEAWLAKHGVLYDRLVMLDLPDAETRRQQRAYGSFKGEFYRSSPAMLFIESELAQAREIMTISKKPVLSLEGPVMFTPGMADPFALVQKLRQPGFLKQLARRVVGGPRYDLLRRRYSSSPLVRLARSRGSA